MDKMFEEIAIDYRLKFVEACDTIKRNDIEIAKLKDKLHRRNMQIKDLKAQLNCLTPKAKQQVKEYSRSKITDEVKSSEFGCHNCLWLGIECKGYEKYEPKEVNGKASCKGYTYYD